MVGAWLESCPSTVFYSSPLFSSIILPLSQTSNGAFGEQHPFTDVRPYYYYSAQRGSIYGDSVYHKISARTSLHSLYVQYGNTYRNCHWWCGDPSVRIIVSLPTRPSLPLPLAFDERTFRTSAVKSSKICEDRFHFEASDWIFVPGCGVIQRCGGEAFSEVLAAVKTGYTPYCMEHGVTDRFRSGTVRYGTVLYCTVYRGI